MKDEISSALREFIDEVVVPALVREYLNYESISLEPVANQVVNTETRNLAA